METKKLFVYGALMVKHKDKQTSFPAYLEGYKVSFEVIGLKFFEPSFAALAAKENSKAYGIIIILPENKFNQYIAHELRYELKKVVAIDMNGITHACLALFLRNPGHGDEIMPSARYAHQLYKGGVYHGLPNDILDYYLNLKKKGNKLTYFLHFLFPLYLKCIPIVAKRYPVLGRYVAFYGIMIFMPAIILTSITVLTIKYLF